MLITKPEAILFDWDNTLVDTWAIIHLALNDTFTEYRLPLWTIEDVRQRVRHSMRDSFPQIFGPRWEEAGEFYRNAYRRHYADTLSALPGAAQVLETLGDSGIVLGVVSNKQGPQLRKEVELLGWDKYFHKVIGASDASHDKPHPAPVLMALEGSGVKPSLDVWMLGDSDIDIECANRCGIRPIYYGKYAPPTDEPHHFCNHEVCDHNSFVDMIQAVLQQKPLG